jgi:hypothetical protein
MANYKWIKLNQSLRRIADGACIPVDAANRDYAAFLASGETPDAEDPPPTADQKAAGATDSITQLEFDVLFNQENRIRTLEGKASITRVQYRDALIARWKVLNP